MQKRITFWDKISKNIIAKVLGNKTRFEKKSWKRKYSIINRDLVNFFIKPRLMIEYFLDFLGR